MNLARARNESFAQAGCALRARFTAAFTSAALHNGTRPISAPVDGSMETISRVCVDERLCVLISYNVGPNYSSHKRKARNDQISARGVYAAHAAKLRRHHSRGARSH